MGKSSENRERLLFEHSPDAIIVSDVTSGVIEDVSRVAYEMLGYSPGELLGRKLESIWKVTSEDSLVTSPSEQIFIVERTFVRKNRSLMILELRSSTFIDNGVSKDISVFRDITQRKEAEKEQDHSRRMDSLEHLAGGVAHEFNNILAIIMGNTELMQYAEITDEEKSKNLSNIINAVKRAKNLVKQILLFSCQGALRFAQIDLSTVVAHAALAVASKLPNSVTVHSMVESGIGKVKADAEQIQQVVINLCTNAFHALRGASGDLYIQLSRAPVTSKVLQGAPALLLSIRDNGVGIPQEHIHEIFDPFFTTKPVGQGTGLGLAVVHGIVRSHEGCIEVESVEGEGSTFSIYLPVAEAPTLRPVIDVKRRKARFGRLLLVEDELELAELYRSYLERQGYTVVLAHDGQSALDIFTKENSAFDLVITDQSMPGMSGKELSEALLKLCPELPIILCTGYSAVVSEQDAQKIGIFAYLNKPLSLSKLRKVILSCFDDKNEPS